MTIIRKAIKKENHELITLFVSNAPNKFFNFITCYETGSTLSKCNNYGSGLLKQTKYENVVELNMI